MPLSTLVEKTKEIQLTIGEITLKPLTLSDFSSLFNKNSEVTEKFFMGEIDFTSMLGDWSSYAELVISMGTAISKEEAAILPIGDQIKCLVEIVDISGIDGEVLGKLILKVVGILEGINKVQEPMRQTEHLETH